MNKLIAMYSLLLLCTSCTLSLSDTEIKDTKGNVEEKIDTKLDPKTEVDPKLTVPVSPK